MFIALKTKIWLTVSTIVLLFTFFTLIYFPAQQRKLLLKNYNTEVQNLANTVALGVRIALNEQNYEGVQTALEFVKGNPGLRFISLVQTDTVWAANHAFFTIKETLFKTVPEKWVLQPADTTDGQIITKRAPFTTSLMSGAILLGFSTAEINQSQAAVRRTSLLVSALIFLVGISMGFWLSRNISVPVQALREGARRVSNGDLETRVKTYSKDEIGDLSKAFNIMVRELSHARENLKQSNQNLSEANTALNKTLDDLKATQNQLIQSERLASLGELTAGIAHEIQNPLNFINNFSEVNLELVDEMTQEFEAGNLADGFAIATDIKENNAKITFHGKRADGIVKGMLQHSRKSTGQKEATDINALADEYLRLSYHGLRAKDKSFNAHMHTDYADAVGFANVVPQDIGRVFLNLFTNAFYAVTEKKKSLGNGFEPCISVTTKKKADAIEISVKDNGMGISKSLQDKIFQPFFTTKPTGLGTGLGLSLSYDIVKAHGGELRVESEEGEGATFKVYLPAASA